MRCALALLVLVLIYQKGSSFSSPSATKDALAEIPKWQSHTDRDLSWWQSGIQCNDQQLS